MIGSGGPASSSGHSTTPASVQIFLPLPLTRPEPTIYSALPVDAWHAAKRLERRNELLNRSQIFFDTPN